MHYKTLKTISITKIFLSLLIFQYFSFCYSQNNNLKNLVKTSQWDSLFPKRAGTYGTHPQGYTTDFYSYNNLNKAVNEMSDYFVIIRSKTGVWGQLITITRKSNQQTYNYSNVDAWWYTNTTPETIVVVDFEQFLNESSSTNNKRELAAFLANISKETTGGWQLPVGSGSAGDYASWGLYFVHEVGYSSSSSAGTYSQSHSEFPPNSKVGYYGRGPIQLSWNYNYGQFSKFIYNDKNILLNYPDSIQESGVLAFKSAIWFWMMPQCPKPSCHQVMHDQWLHDSAYSSKRMYYKGFAHTNNIINGGLECRTSASSAYTAKVTLRSELFKYYLKIMGFNSTQIALEDTSGYSTKCYISSTDAMQDYSNCKVNNSYYGKFSLDSQNVCGSLKWINGITYKKTTKTVFYSVKNKKNLDSFILLNLTVKPIPTSIDSQISCNSFTWKNGITYKNSTDSAFRVMAGGAANGCDSIVKLKLTILKSAYSTDTQTACNSYTWMDGKTYTKSTDSAIFVFPKGAKNGCDSIVKLHLTILKSSVKNDAQTACGSFTWINGITYSKSTDSAFVIYPKGASNGCDSIVNLKLNILNPTKVIQTLKTCKPFTWLDGITYSQNTDTPRFVFKHGAANGCDSIINLNLTILPSSIKKDNQIACGAFKWIDGKTYFNSTDTPKISFQGAAANGCDSIINLNLTLIPIGAKIYKDSGKLKVDQTNASYQWVDCEDNYASITGAMSHSFSPPSNGKYAVVIKTNNCLDTTDCFEVTYLNTKHYSVNNSKNRIYPNPCSYTLNVHHNFKIDKLELINSFGQIIQNQKCNSTQVEINVSTISDGIYLIKIYSGNNVYTDHFMITK